MALELARQEELYYYNYGYGLDHEYCGDDIDDDQEGVIGGDYRDDIDQRCSTVDDGLRTRDHQHSPHGQQLGATVFASKFAANTRRGTRVVQKGGAAGLDPDATSLKMTKKLFKPEDPDFSADL